MHLLGCAFLCPLSHLSHPSPPDRCVGPDGRDCMRRRAKVTPHTMSIASEDFAAWVEDAREVLEHSADCPNFLFHFRFVMVSLRGGKISAQSQCSLVVHRQSISSRHLVTNLSSLPFLFPRTLRPPWP